MKIIRSLIIGVGIITANLVHAQDTDLTATNIDWSSAPDWQVALQAIEQVPPMPAIDVTNGTTFWSAEHNPASSEPWPPLPANIAARPLWDLGNGTYLLDDVGYSYFAVKRQKANSASLSTTGGTMVMAADDVPSPPGDGSTNDYSPAGELEGLSPDYGTNLWISQMSQGAGNYSGIISNTISQIPYEIQYSYDLLSTNWQSADWIFPGSEATNWTTFSVPMVSPTNMFFRVRSWETDNASGMPLWWEEEYFGTNSVNPNAQDSAGDGWTIYQKYLMGVPPATFVTPPTPQGVTSSYDPNTDLVTVNWQPAPGPVTSYTVNIDGNNYSVSAGSTSFQNNISDDSAFYDVAEFGPSYVGSVQVVANYIGGNSSAASVSLQPTIGNFGYLDSGQQGQAYLTVAAVPPGTVVVKITRVDFYAELIEDDSSFDTNFTISISAFTNGVAALPAPWSAACPVDGYSYSDYDWWIQTVDAQGNASGAARLTYGYAENASLYYNDYSMTSAQWPTKPWFDGREQLKQNLIFLLRAGLTGQPFTYSENYTDGTAQQIISYPTNYAYADFYDFDYDSGVDPLANVGVFRPFGENYLYDNFVFNLSNLDGYGYLSSINNSLPGPVVIGLVEPPSYVFEPPTVSGTTITPILSTNDTRWLYSSRLYYSPTFGAETFGSSTEMLAGYQNTFGLSFLSVEMAWGNSAADTLTLYPGQSTNLTGVLYADAAQPELQTTEYDFWNPNLGYWNSGNWTPLQPLPGMSGFSPTNESSLQITGVGQQDFLVAGFAKEALLNGYSGVYGYLGQYFQAAYQMTNGVVTTNQTGVLSPYGDFFATQPGPAALVTMPDPDTGAQGTTTVYCVSLALDANHDGNMDLNFGGADATSPIKPMEFWVNDGCDVAGSGGGLDYDLAVPPGKTNYTQGVITCGRDLENFARLWVCGLPSALSNDNYYVSLSCSAISGSPAINLYYAGTNGGIGYLTNATAASSLVGEPALATITPTSLYFFPAWSLDGTNQYFLFEGAGIGEGQFTLTVYQGSNTIAQTSVYIDLHDINDFYERAFITDNMTGAKSNWTSSVESVQEATTSALGDDTNLMVLVHGINVPEWNWFDDSDTVFKRLYWAGFRGQFASVKWPCNLLTPIPSPLSPANFNDSELQGYKASTAFTNYIGQFRARYPGYRLNILAHSQGNTVASEAIMHGMSFDTYILTQGALPANAYDVNTTNYPDLIGLSSTPEWRPMGYQGVYTNLSATGGNIVNFYNPNDGVLKIWITDQEDLKPSVYFDLASYYYDGTNSYYDPLIGSTYLVTDPEESRAEVSRSLTLSIGQSGPASAHGVVTSAVNLNSQFGFNDSIAEHSAQWTWPIQTTLPYYKQVLLQIQPTP